MRKGRANAFIRRRLPAPEEISHGCFRDPHHLQAIARAVEAMQDRTPTRPTPIWRGRSLVRLDEDLLARALPDLPADLRPIAEAGQAILRLAA